MLTFHLPTMHCGGCARGVTTALQRLDAAATVTIDLQTRTVQIETTVPSAQVVRALTEAGFAPASIP